MTKDFYLKTIKNLTTFERRHSRWLCGMGVEQIAYDDPEINPEEFREILAALTEYERGATKD